MHINLYYFFTELVTHNIDFGDQIQRILDNLKSGRIITASEFKGLEIGTHLLSILQKAIHHAFYFQDYPKTIVYMASCKDGHDMEEVLLSLDTCYSNTDNMVIK